MSQRVVVTAAARGIGRAIADRFLASGATVWGCDVDDEALGELRAALPSVKAARCDVGDKAQVESFLAEACKSMGGIDVLVNNAGIGGGHAAVEDVTDENWDRSLAVNLSGMFYCVRKVVPLMKAQGSGCIINISTGSVRTGLPNRLPYVASKHGVMGLTQNLARELGPANIRCNAILPGLIDNPRGRALVQRAADEAGKSFEEFEADMLKYISMRTWIDPLEIGDTAVFLASHAARHITGQFLGVCGGVEWEP
ncbi:SDR family oxidoreductase [Roseiterribacter gracilis]|uniref:3-ketoacyl-ACP reductase n=1 Tax=Roseiterribacter gracilis TaxID=2812848 RepID=A0A8S8X9J1_9PROT|nr:3-ketoacyl-ACP reductase [Rhodospirillales bacterium TMPK1]